MDSKVHGLNSSFKPDNYSLAARYSNTFLSIR